MCCAVPTGLGLLVNAYPALKRWAKIFRPARGTRHEWSQRPSRANPEESCRVRIAVGTPMSERRKARKILAPPFRAGLVLDMTVSPVGTADESSRHESGVVFDACNVRQGDEFLLWWWVSEHRDVWCTVPTGLGLLFHAYPVLKHWAKIFRPASGTRPASARSSLSTNATQLRN